MKTTLDLPDELLIEAKATAARRRTTLRAIVEHALRREISELSSTKKTNDQIGTTTEGLPCYKRKGEAKVTSEIVYALIEDEGI